MRTLFPPYALPAPGVPVDPDTTVVLTLPGPSAPTPPDAPSLRRPDAPAPDRPDAGLPGRPDAVLPGRPDAVLPGRPDAVLPGRPDAVLLGLVDLGYAGRSLADVLADLDRWSGYPVAGIYFDRAPAGPFSVGAVALTLRVARRHGLHRLVLNPGTPVHPLYRELGVAICTFEGDWLAYQRWSAEGTAAGDGHLVYGVPTAQLTAARLLLTHRGAGFGLATDAHPTRTAVAAAHRVDQGIGIADPPGP